MEVILFTENGKGGRGFLTNSLVTDFQNEYPPIRIKPNPDCHDRLIVLDYGEETERVYHCGASSKDAGKYGKSIEGRNAADVLATLQVMQDLDSR